MLKDRKDSLGLIMESLLREGKKDKETKDVEKEETDDTQDGNKDSTGSKSDNEKQVSGIVCPKCGKDKEVYLTDGETYHCKTCGYTWSKDEEADGKKDKSVGESKKKKCISCSESTCNYKVNKKYKTDDGMVFTVKKMNKDGTMTVYDEDSKKEFECEIGDMNSLNPELLRESASGAILTDYKRDENGLEINKSEMAKIRKYLKSNFKDTYALPSTGDYKEGGRKYSVSKILVSGSDFDETLVCYDYKDFLSKIKKYSKGLKEGVQEAYNVFKDFKKIKSNGNTVPKGCVSDGEGGIYEIPKTGTSAMIPYNKRKYQYDFKKRVLTAYSGKEVLDSQGLSAENWADGAEYWIEKMDDEIEDLVKSASREFNEGTDLGCISTRDGKTCANITLKHLEWCKYTSRNGKDYIVHNIRGKMRVYKESDMMHDVKPTQEILRVVQVEPYTEK